MKLATLPILSTLALAIPMCVQGATIYSATLNSANEVPPTSSPATGAITVTLTGDTLSVNEVFSGLLAPASAAHIHCCSTVGVASGVALPFTNFPTTESGTYLQSFDLTSASVYNSAFLTAEGGTAASAEAALVAGLNAGDTYANIHDSINPGGEIRGQLAATPEPSAVGLAMFGLGALLMARRKRKS